MALQVKNLSHIAPAEMTAIADRARAIRSGAVGAATEA
jgi:uncharacterized protein YfkK (UPF0435 family)